MSYEGQTGFANENLLYPKQIYEQTFSSFSYGSYRPFNYSTCKRQSDFLYFIVWTMQPWLNLMDTSLFSWGFIELCEEIAEEVIYCTYEDMILQKKANDIVIFSKDEDFQNIDYDKYQGGIWLNEKEFLSYNNANGFDTNLDFLNGEYKFCCIIRI